MASPRQPEKKPGGQCSYTGVAIVVISSLLLSGFLEIR